MRIRNNPKINMVRGPIRYGARYSAIRQLYCAAFISPRVLHLSAFHFIIATVTYYLINSYLQ